MTRSAWAGARRSVCSIVDHHGGVWSEQSDCLCTVAGITAGLCPYVKRAYTNPATWRAGVHLEYISRPSEQLPPSPAAMSQPIMLPQGWEARWYAPSPPRPR